LAAGTPVPADSPRITDSSQFKLVAGQILRRAAFDVRQCEEKVAVMKFMG
jgi:hypothetical protein